MLFLRIRHLINLDDVYSEHQSHDQRRDDVVRYNKENAVYALILGLLFMIIGALAIRFNTRYMVVAIIESLAYNVKVVE